MDIYKLHYILNSIVGKYTDLELVQGEVEKEVDNIYETLLFTTAKDRGIL